MAAQRGLVYDVAVVGGGIVGLSTAMQLLERRPGLALCLLEKEPRLGTHQTGRNSGVIHSGVYYAPGSLKAKLCVAGAVAMRAFCEVHRIPFAMCGKLIVAVDISETARLRALYERGLANGVEGLSLIGPEELRDLEPSVRGVQALYIRSAGIVSYSAVVEQLAEQLKRQGGTIRTGAGVMRLIRERGDWRLVTSTGEIRARYVVTCGGLQSDRLAAQAGAPHDMRIVPFRGEYYELIAARRSLVQRLIYPVPDPAVPFLGVHLTPTIDGRVLVGPNAVLALKREGYRKRDISLRDLMDLACFGGFWRMAWARRATAWTEGRRSFSRRIFAEEVARLVPGIVAEDLMPARSGVRAQAVDAAGAFIEDFDFIEQPGAIHIRNVPSPAATASLAIGGVIADRALKGFSLGASMPAAVH